MIRLSALILASLTLLTSPAFARLPATPEIEAEVDALLVENGISGAVVLIREQGEKRIITRGVTDRTTLAPIPQSVQLRIASIGKIHTAAIIHSLIRDGQLSLDDRLADLVAPHWVEGIANADQASVRQLLTHTSGIPDYYDDVWFQTVNTVQGNTPQRTLGFIHGRPADFPPGEGYGYSNSNYQYLALIAEAVSGQSFGTLLQRRLIEPLNLEATSYNEPLEGRDLIHGYGAPNDPDRDAYALIGNHGPDGGVFTSASDLADTLTALFSADGALADLGQLMLSEEVDRGEGRSRALGPMRIRDPRGLDMIMHGGSIAGYASLAIYELNTGMIIIVHLSADRPDLAGQLVRQLLQ
ncbi:serine hydrolase [Oceanicaulis sp. MMSF_3324]|uniref:serine hydrolase domain-containing protein n=1 Tax=Oceanicaulis sp. MMSF_3324 TaxID=3046702 RepID=UPI00273E404B|nr:serine hydrolase domain-containing protein [Oceanicaulis sp. MMSF_3324]